MNKVVKAAQELQVSEPTLRRWIKQGKVKVIRLPNGEIRVPDEELNRLKTGGN
jgi:excisionase family DNA binding protein